MLKDIEGNAIFFAACPTLINLSVIVGHQQIFFNQQSMMGEGPRIPHPNCCQITWQLPAPDSNSCHQHGIMIQKNSGAIITQFSATLEMTAPVQCVGHSASFSWVRRVLKEMSLKDSNPHKMMQSRASEMMPRCANRMNKHWRKQQRAHWKYRFHPDCFHPTPTPFQQCTSAWVRLDTKPTFDKITRVTTRAAK